MISVKKCVNEQRTVVPELLTIGQTEKKNKANLTPPRLVGLYMNGPMEFFVWKEGEVEE